MIKTLATLILIISNNLYACGCHDSASAGAGATQIINAYKSADSQLEQSFRKLLDEENKTLDIEKENSELLNKTLTTTVETLVVLKKILKHTVKNEVYLYKR